VLGQTGRPFNTRYKEHIRDIKNNSSKSGYSNHILNTGYSYGNITDTPKIIKIERKGKHLNT
jgi:Cys-tRNA synthase (O-phospho-L-seryl-tRNA:Cys-tRNA synthase)